MRLVILSVGVVLGSFETGSSLLELGDVLGVGDGSEFGKSWIAGLLGLGEGGKV